MEDSFFGFNTGLPLDDSSGRIAEPSEEEYDALNDETFGSAINSDWEEVHENLVRLRENYNGNSLDSSAADEYGDKHLFSSAATSVLSTPAPATKSSRMRPGDPFADSDLELNLSGMKLDDMDVCYDDSEGLSGIQTDITLDPGVWSAQPVKPSHPPPYRDPFSGTTGLSTEGGKQAFGGVNPADFLQEHFSTPFRQQQPHQQKSEINASPSSVFGLQQLQATGNAPKICTLEDIERNLIIQQTLEKQQHKQQQQLLLNDILKQGAKSAVNTTGPQSTQQQQHPQQQKQQQPAALPQQPIKGQLGFWQQQANVATGRMPHGFPPYPPGLGPHLPPQAHQQLPPHPLLNQHGLPPNFPHAHQRPLPNPHLPIALNNFAMHPNFNAMRAAAVAAGIHPAALVPPHQQQPRLPPHPPNPAALLNTPQPNSMYNMFNMRLVQEIQQNHPLLQNAARQSQQQQQQQQQQQNAAGFNNGNIMNNMHHHQLQLQQRNGGAKQHQHRREGISSNGNLPAEEFDEYANLMSTRDKHWLIGIQLSQLNTDTPYIDDYYYTVYRERKATLNGNPGHSEAHKDNQLNHPLTQPKGHAQLILVQLGNKNGTRNGQHREHRNSEAGGNSNIDQKTPYVFTPLKFENSLGKLQYGSVTAPRKIIDAEIMSGDSTAIVGSEGTAAASNASAQSKSGSTVSVLSSHSAIGLGVICDVTTTSQRKSRHILLHIETLFRIILKLEDLDNPKAIATIVMKKKKENERIAALEQLENANKTPEERAAEDANPQSMNPALKYKFAYEIETKEALVSKLIAGLTHDKIIGMMNVRKGKVLVRRVMPHLEDNDLCWNVWISVFASLQNVLKKDPEDAEGILYALYPHLKKQIKCASFDTIVKLSNAIPLSDKKSNGIFSSKFGISSLVCLILQAEQIYVTDQDPTLDSGNKESWRHFLDQAATSLNRTIQNQTICAAIESDSIQPMMNHFARFKDLKLDSLLALITEAKQQIN